jgi:acylphosphatase
VKVDARQYFISGRVQGVGYRYFASKEGKTLHLNGWVRNLADGRVEAYAAGEVAGLDAFEARLREGPRAG